LGRIGYSITRHYLLYPLYDSETWTVKAKDARRITAAEMKYMRKTAGYTWTDYKQMQKLRRS